MDDSAARNENERKERDRGQRGWDVGVGLLELLSFGVLLLLSVCWAVKITAPPNAEDRAHSTR